MHRFPFPLPLPLALAHRTGATVHDTCLSHETRVRLRTEREEEGRERVGHARHNSGLCRCSAGYSTQHTTAVRGTLRHQQEKQTLRERETHTHTSHASLWSSRTHVTARKVDRVFF